MFFATKLCIKYLTPKGVQVSKVVGNEQNERNVAENVLNRFLSSEDRTAEFQHQHAPAGSTHELIGMSLRIL